MINPFQDYLAHLQETLPFGGSRRKHILSEIEAHLQESWEQEQQLGTPPEEALTRVLQRFGSPTVIGAQFTQLEQERRLRLGKQCGQRSFLFLVPLLFCYLIAAFTFLGYDAPRQTVIHLTNDLGDTLSTLHAQIVGFLLLGWLIIGGPLACIISGTTGILTLKSWSRVTWLNLFWTILGLTFLLFEIYSLLID